MSKSTKPNFSPAYAQIASAPIAWQTTARGLIYSANLLYQNYATKVASRPSNAPSTDAAFYGSWSGTVAIMLYGMAIENLVKGLLIAKGTPAMTQDTFNLKLRTHNLNKLFKEAQISDLHQEDEDLLGFLTDEIESAKYPIALTEKWSLDHRYFKIRKPTTADIRQHVFKFIDLLENELRTFTKHPIGVQERIDLLTLGLNS